MTKLVIGLYSNLDGDWCHYLAENMNLVLFYSNNIKCRTYELSSPLRHMLMDVWGLKPDAAYNDEHMTDFHFPCTTSHKAGLKAFQKAMRWWDWVGWWMGKPRPKPPDYHRMSTKDLLDFWGKTFTGVDPRVLIRRCRQKIVEQQPKVAIIADVRDRETAKEIARMENGLVVHLRDKDQPEWELGNALVDIALIDYTLTKEEIWVILKDKMKAVLDEYSRHLFALQ